MTRNEFHQKMWPLSIRKKVEDYIDSNYRSEYKAQAKKQYSHMTPINGRVFLEFHNRSDCSLKFNRSELEEIQNVVGI